MGRSLVGSLMLLGIWVSGPLWMTVENTLAPGEGFRHSGSIMYVIFGTLTFSLTTYMASTYQGTMGALILTTLVLPVFSLVRRRALVPAPSTGVSVITSRPDQIARRVMIAILVFFGLLIVATVLMWSTASAMWHLPKS